ncbi:hypothetical protein SeLEV6574_g04733, partial [Synchytrium endobioticum]
ATHPLAAAVRRNCGPELAHPVTVGDDVWIGGNVVILPNVKIGEGAVIGAGAVVTKDVPPYSLAVGNPAKVIKQLPREADKTNPSS